MRMTHFAMMVLGAFFAATLSAAVELQSPKGGLTLRVWEEGGKAFYSVSEDKTLRVLPSRLGFNTKEAGNFSEALAMGEASLAEGSETWRPVVGDNAEECIAYKALRVPFTGKDGTFHLEARVAEEGVAFRYLLPEKASAYTIARDDEATTLALPEGTVAYGHAGRNQTMPGRFDPKRMPECCRQLTLSFKDGAAMGLGEADFAHFAVLRWASANGKETTLKVRLGSDVRVEKGVPAATPWRVMMFAKNEGLLPEKQAFLESLCPAANEAKYHFADWVRPGTSQRLITLTNAAGEKLIDECAKRGIRYILLDTGWSGPENDERCDPRLDPTLLKPGTVAGDKILKERHFYREGEGKPSLLPNGEGVFRTYGQGFAKYGRLGQKGDMIVDLDIPALCAYGKRKGVGVILYVNKVMLPDRMGRFTVDELFAHFEKWGVAGAKPGFVNCNTQKAEAIMREVVEAAAKHKLVLTVHDEWVPVGLHRTFPNLLTAEAILGDEARGGLTPKGDISALFTRLLQGPADHTFCWPGKASKGYALASPVLFRSGLHHIFWYTDPAQTPAHDAEAVDLTCRMPATWKTTRWLEGKFESHATVARQTPEGVWYIASIAAIDRNLNLTLDFLDKNVAYRAECFADAPNAHPNLGWNHKGKVDDQLTSATFTAKHGDTLTHHLRAKTGLLFRLTPAPQK